MKTTCGYLTLSVRWSLHNYNILPKVLYIRFLDEINPYMISARDNMKANKNVNTRQKWDSKANLIKD